MYLPHRYTYTPWGAFKILYLQQQQKTYSSIAAQLQCTFLHVWVMGDCAILQLTELYLWNLHEETI